MPDIETTKDVLIDINGLKIVIEELQKDIEDSISAITLEASDDDEGKVAKIYTLKNGDIVIGKINIPKDQFLKGSDLVTISDSDIIEFGEEVPVGVTVAGKYIKLSFQDDSIVYLNVNELVDVYKASNAEDTMVTLTLDSETNTFSADFSQKAKDKITEIDEKIEALESNRSYTIATEAEIKALFKTTAPPDEETEPEEPSE